MVFTYKSITHEWKIPNLFRAEVRVLPVHANLYLAFEDNAFIVGLSLYWGTVVLKGDIIGT